MITEDLGEQVSAALGSASTPRTKDHEVSTSVRLAESRLVSGHEPLD
jgi:hypothetical protein